MEPFTLAEAVWIVMEGQRLIRGMRAMPKRTVENWPMFDYLWDELDRFNRLFDARAVVSAE